MKSFKEHLNEGMPKGMIAAFDGPKGEVQIFRKGFGFYGDAWDKFDFSANYVKELANFIKKELANLD